MKILHIGDLHLGKKVSGYSLLEDQEYFLNQTINLMKEKDIKHLIIAGDIYDVSSPGGDAINVFSSFLNKLNKNGIKAFIVSGNHDSKDRIGYGNKLIGLSKIYINSRIDDAISPICEDDINYYLIPYTTAAEINSIFEKSFKDYEEAFKYVIGLMNIDKTKINIAVAHQLVLSNGNSPITGGSEDPIIGTIQNISSNVFEDFTYTALGHIHRPQNASNTIRYCGSPLAYHLDETKFQKTYTIIDITNGKLTITEEEIKPLRKTVVLKDTFKNIINNYPNNVNDYVYAIITDSPVENAMNIIKNKYPYALSLKYDRKEVEGVDLSKKVADIENISYEDLFADFFSQQMNQELSDFQKSIVKECLEEDANNED